MLVDGRLKWIIDAYTTSARFPYSQPFAAPTERGALLADAPSDPTATAVQDLDGVNYLRNAVKVVVDAYDGAVDFYTFDTDDPILSAWRDALPGMFQPRSAMPEALERHVRYPEGRLLTHGLVYAKYHMDDPEVFYNQAAGCASAKPSARHSPAISTIIRPPPTPNRLRSAGSRVARSR